MKKKTLPRGLRNNNPGNIRHNGDKFQGEIAGADKAFKTFSSMSYGYRAMFRILTNYIDRYGCNTIETIIHRWAPPSENHTESYIASVCKETNKGPKEVVAANDRETMCNIVAAMSRVENGVAPNLIYIEQGWDLL